MKLRNILFSLAIMFIGITSVNASDNILSYFDVNSKDLYQINSSKYLSGSSISIAYRTPSNDSNAFVNIFIYKANSSVDFICEREKFCLRI